MSRHNFAGHARSIAAGQHMRFQRMRRGLSLETLAAQIGVSASWLSRIESGQRDVTLGLLLRIADALEIEVTSLLPVSEDRPMVSYESMWRALLRHSVATREGR